LPIVGVGGVVDARSALELMAVGASAVQVGTASFADSRAPYKILSGVRAWMTANGIGPRDLIGSIRAPERPDEFGDASPSDIASTRQDAAGHGQDADDEVAEVDSQVPASHPRGSHGTAGAGER
jgi:hypothetical protein